MFQTSGESRYPSLLDRCIYIMIALQKVCHTASKNSKKYFPFWILGENLWYLLTAFFHWRRIVEKHGLFLYNLYDSQFMHGALPAPVLWRNLEFASVLPRYHWTLPLDLVVLVSLLEEVIGISFKSSEYVILEWFSSFPFPLWFHEKFFWRKHKDLSRTISKPDVFSFDVFSDFQLWKSPKSFLNII